MMIIRLALLMMATLTLIPAGASAELTRRQRGDLAIEARSILRKYCYECHEGTTPSYGRVSVTHHSRLTGKAGPIPFVSKDPKAPRSQVIEFLEDGSMPPGGRPRPTPAEIQRLKEWVAAAAPNYPAEFDDPRVLESVLDDFDEQPENDHPFLRYLSLAHLVPGYGEQNKLKGAEDALQKALLVASGGAMKAPPEPVDDTATLFRLDIRTVGWHHVDLFEKVEQESGKGVYPMIPFDLILLDYPHDHHRQNRNQAVRTADMLKSMKVLRAVPFVRADWLAEALVKNGEPTPLADDLTSLTPLAEAIAKGVKPPNGPPFRPFASGKTLAVAVPPLGSWNATDVTPDPAPFHFNAKLVDPLQKPTESVKLSTQFLIQAECDRDVQLSLFTVLDDGNPESFQVIATPMARGSKVSSGKLKPVFPEGDESFIVASMPKSRNTIAVHYVLFAAEGERPPAVTVVRSKHSSGKVWRIIPTEGNSLTTVRKILTMTVTR